MSFYLFGRTYELTYTTKDGSEIKFEQNKDKMGLAVEFQVQKSKDPKSDTAVVSIYNPSPNTLGILQKEGVVTLKAGYNDNFGIICNGNKEYTKLDTSTIDKRIDIHINQSAVALSKSIFSENYSAGTPASKIAKDLIDFLIANNDSINDWNFYPIVSTLVYPTKQVFFGKADQLLSDLLRSIQYQYTVTNGTIYVRPIDGFLAETSITVTSNSGLIGSPTQVSEADSKKKSVNGVEFSTMLNNKFVVGRQVILRTKNFVNKIYKIDSVYFTGNSFQGDWMSTVRATEINEQ